MEQAVTLVGGLVGILGIASLLVSYGIWRGKNDTKVEMVIKNQVAGNEKMDIHLADDRRSFNEARDERSAIRRDISNLTVGIARLDERSGG